jgi:hypothetical protein
VSPLRGSDQPESWRGSAGREHLDLTLRVTGVTEPGEEYLADGDIVLMS